MIHNVIQLLYHLLALVLHIPVASALNEVGGVVFRCPPLGAVLPPPYPGLCLNFGWRGIHGTLYGDNCVPQNAFKAVFLRCTARIGNYGSVSTEIDS